mgnify:CR=1 FL=1
MAVNKSRKIPRFYNLRIYLFSVVLYYWLVLPFLLILTIKYAPDLREKTRLKESGGISLADTLPDFGDSISRQLNQYIGNISDTLLLSDTLYTKLEKNPGTDINISPQGIKITSEDQSLDQDSGTEIGKAFNILLNLLLISFFLGFLFALPFKRYFSKKRKNKKISPGLFKFCKRFLLKSPLIHAGILGLSFVAAHVYMVVTLLGPNGFDNELERSLYVHLFYISLTASVLSLMFVYFWEKHRVHIRYLEHIFSSEELRRRIFKLKVGRIRNRMFLSSAMTTLLPLTIVILYLFLSVTYLGDLDFKTFSEEQKSILFGDYVMFTELFGGGEELRVPSWLFYINAINSFFMFIGIYSSIFIAFVYILFLVKWTTQDIVHPVKELLLNMKKTEKGELNNFSIVRTNDEIGELTEGYNEMTHKIGDYIHNISRMTEAYSYFVPRQFLDFLGKESFVDIKLGDQVEKEMTVMFSDIRSFTEISEQMTPKENFDFINYYLGYMEPVIRNNNGFIDKYIGDSIMALFGDKAEDAINASIEMRIKLSQFNQVMDQFGKPKINSGIGIHSGELMLGVVGGEGRMDGTVISDAVNLAARLEGLTKLYGSSIIISQDTLIRLSDPGQYNYRFLDIVKVKGKQEAVYIFEIIDGDPEDIKQLKLKTKNLFGQGVNLYKSGKFEEALKVFIDVLEENNQDTTAQLYVTRCRKFKEQGVPEDWDGIMTINWN